MNKVLTAVLIGSLSFSVAALADKKSDKSQNLPYGLEKKQAKGEPLPPGWQKKLKIGSKIDQEVIEHGEVILKDDKGLVTIKVEGKIVKIIENTQEIIEILNTI